MFLVHLSPCLALQHANYHLEKELKKVKSCICYNVFLSAASFTEGFLEGSCSPGEMKKFFFFFQNFHGWNWFENKVTL